MKTLKLDAGIIRQNALTMFISLAGGLVAQWVNMPAGLLAGGAISVAFAGGFGLKLGISKPIIYASFIIIGMAVGVNISSDSLQLASQWPLSMLSLLIALIIIVVMSAMVLQRFFGLDRATAFFAAMPGHFSLILALTSSGIADRRRVSIIMSVRVLVLTVILPFGAMLGGHLPAPSIFSGPDIEMVPLVLLAISCLGGGIILMVLKVPGGLILGAMAVAVGGKLAGFHHGNLPGPLSGFAFVSMGALIGSRMSGINWQELRQSLFAGLTVTFISIGVVSALAWLLTFFMNMPTGQLWLGLAPGGLEAMIALGLAFGYDSAFVAAHHTWRLFLLGIAIPLLAPVFSRKK